jgi:hypothetical protein
MSHFSGVTFAFSHKDRVWRTRYSFTPTSYAYVDNFFLSTNGTHPSASNGNQEGIWRHDTNNSHNLFYGFQYDMSVAFVANYNPSGVKMFKSLSAESNSNSWSGFVTTNNNPAGSDQSEAQKGDLNAFVRKEGASYVEIPPSEINSTSNVSAAYSALGGIAYNLPLGSASEVGLSPNNPMLTWSTDIDTQYGQITVGRNSFVVVRGPFGLSYIQGAELIPIEGASPSYNDGYAIIESFDPEDSTVNIQMLVAPGDIGLYPFNWMVEFDFTDVYINAPAKTNGDYMRGHYMNVYLTNNSVAPVECLAFNVNYEATKLDHSLGQNA